MEEKMNRAACEDMEYLTPTAVDRVSNYIKNMIIFKELKPGDRIPTEVELCRILNVGRGSVREALKILEATHLIQIRRGDGTYISHPDDISFANSLLFKMILTNTSMDEMVEFREQVEISAVHLAVAHVQPEDLLLLQENIALFTACIENTPSDYAQLHKLDMGFHRLFAACMKNKLMEEIYLLAMDIFSPTILNNFETGQVLGADAQTTLISHKTIVQALETRDIHLGVHGVWQMLDIWKRWANKKKE